MAISPSTVVKNSGILRYTFGGTSVAPAPQFPALTGGDPAAVIQCLGSNALVIPDEDDHVFGLFPGCAAITGKAGTLFSGSNVVAANMVQPGRRVVGVNNLFDEYIPAGTKLHAYFCMTNALIGTSAVAAEAPVMLVQWEVKFNRPIRAGVEDSTGKQFISSVRVAVQNVGAATTKAAGVLVVELQHSEHDLTGAFSQDGDYTYQSVD